MPRHRPHEKPKSLEFGPYGPRSMKQVYQFVDFSPTVPPKLRETGLGALLMLAGLHAALESEPLLDVLARIPANVPLLRSYLTKSHAIKHKYSAGAWRNMRVGVFACLRAAGVQVRQGRKRVRLPEPFQAFCDQLKEDERKILFPLLRWCVEEGLKSLAEVTQETFERYEAYLFEFDGRSNRRAAFTDVVRVWRAAGTAYPRFALNQVSIVSKRDRFVLAWTEFPVYAEIQEMMQAAMAADPEFPRRRKRINARSALHQTQQLRRLLSALAHATGIDPGTITSLKQLVQPTAARAALRFLASRSHERQLARKRDEDSA